jgi:hypothetical protein
LFFLSYSSMFLTLSSLPGTFVWREFSWYWGIHHEKQKFNEMSHAVVSADLLIALLP